VVLLLAGILIVSGCSSKPQSNATGGTGNQTVTPAAGETPKETSAANPTIVAAAEKAGFTTFASVVRSAGLESTLNEGGPFTVFAPTNEAFNKLPAGTLEKLSKDPTSLRNILTYHVVQGKYMAADLKNGLLTSVQGSALSVNITDNKVMIGNSTVTEPDIVASNGVIHGIDEVLIPPAK
jgi:uncharacterized surface protein with fasciclin (FAS1) repeats